MKSMFSHLFTLIIGGLLLVGCASSPNVEFSPAEPEDVEEKVVAVRTYPSTLVSSAEKLYGADPGGDSPIYREAMKKNPNLGYNVIYFDFNSSQIDSKLHEVLAEHAIFMQDHPMVSLVLEGHADKRGTAGYNLALGERRALAVKTILQANGVEASRVKVISYGEERPAVDGDSEEIYSRNRRVEIIYK